MINLKNCYVSKIRSETEGREMPSTMQIDDKFFLLFVLYLITVVELGGLVVCVLLLLLQIATPFNKEKLSASFS